MGGRGQYKVEVKSQDRCLASDIERQRDLREAKQHTYKTQRQVRCDLTATLEFVSQCQSSLLIVIVQAVAGFNVLDYLKATSGSSGTPGRQSFTTACRPFNET